MFRSSITYETAASRRPQTLRFEVTFAGELRIPAKPGNTGLHALRSIATLGLSGGRRSACSSTHERESQRFEAISIELLWRCCVRTTDIPSKLQPRIHLPGNRLNGSNLWQDIAQCRASTSFTDAIKNSISHLPRPKLGHLNVSQLGTLSTAANLFTALQPAATARRPETNSIATSGRSAQLTYVASLVVEAAAGGTALSVSASATPFRVRRWSASK